MDLITLLLTNQTKRTISFTEAEEAVLTRINEQSNPAGAPELIEFTVSLLSDLLDAKMAEFLIAEERRNNPPQAEPPADPEPEVVSAEPEPS